MIFQMILEISGDEFQLLDFAGVPCLKPPMLQLQSSTPQPKRNWATELGDGIGRRRFPDRN